MMLIEDIYCDMDQVLVNFLLGTRLALGKEFNDFSLGHDSQKWAMLRDVPDFWRKLPWMPGARAIWDRIKHKDPHILSACPNWHDAPTCWQEKTDWCASELSLPDYRVKLVMARTDKRLFATNGNVPNLLIDDHPGNVYEWRERGGIAIHHHTVPETLIELSKLGL
jgi:hypothetical protein